MSGPQLAMEQKFHRLCRQVVEDCALELYHLEYRAAPSLLRVMIQDPQTKKASIEHCVSVDRALSPFIEQEQWMPERLTLEVSSPGLDRPLKSKRHFEQSIGEKIVVKLGARSQAPETVGTKNKDKKQYRVEGILKWISDERIGLKVKGEEIDIPVNDIKEARWVLPI